MIPYGWRIVIDWRLVDSSSGGVEPESPAILAFPNESEAIYDRYRNGWCLVHGGASLSFYVRAMGQEASMLILSQTHIQTLNNPKIWGLNRPNAVKWLPWPRYPPMKVIGPVERVVGWMEVEWSHGQNLVVW